MTTKLQDMVFVIKLSNRGKNAYTFTFDENGNCRCPECKYIEEICGLVDSTIEPFYETMLRTLENDGGNIEACEQWCNNKKVKASFDVGKLKYNRLWRGVYITTDKSVLA